MNTPAPQGAADNGAPARVRRSAHALLVLLLMSVGCHAAEPTAAQTQDTSAAVPAVTTAPEATTLALPPKAKFHIYLLMGQSNMAGRDRRKLNQQVDNARVLALTADDQWVVARDPIHPQQGRTLPGAGPGIPFGKDSVSTVGSDPTVTIGLVPLAVGGSPLKRWQKSGDLYAIAIARAQIAAQYGTISGVLWQQGEADAANATFAARYQSSLATMLGNLRTDLGLPNLPIVVGQLGTFLLPADYPYADTVRAALRNMPSLVPNVGYVDSAGLTHQGDNLHFDADSAQTLGERFSQAMQDLQNP